MNRLRPWIEKVRLDSPTRIAYAGIGVAVLVLLFDSPGLAIVIASLIVPAVVLTELPRRDVFEHEPRWASPAMVAWGALVGIVAGAIGAAVVASLWIEGAALHVGSAGFGGTAAERAGSPGFGVLLLNGIALAAGSIAVATFGPYAMRRYPVFRNEVMDGITLGVAAGCGVAVGTTIVQVWPILTGSANSAGSVSDWTAMLFGLLVTRPLIFGALTAFLCAGLWHVALSERTPDLVIPVSAGLGGAVVFAFGDLLIQPSGARFELVWHIVVLAALSVVARFIFRRSLEQDRLLLREAGGRRTVCPACGSVTPAGTFCAVCGQALEPERPQLAVVEAEPIAPEALDDATADAQQPNPEPDEPLAR